MPIEFEHAFTRLFTTTITRAVGPTTETGARGTLPEPAPSDSNVIFLAPNGDDGDAGTEAAPKLTVAGANAALTGSLPVIHAFRNGFVGEIIFTLTGNVTLAADRHMQVEEGEIAKVDADTHLFALGNNGILNGIHFTSDQDTQYFSAGLTGGEIDNCIFESTIEPSLLGSTPALLATNVAISHTIFSHPHICLHYDLLGDATLDNCVFLTPNNSETAFLDASGYTDSGVGVFLGQNLLGPSHTITLNRCMFVNNKFAFSDGLEGAGGNAQPTPGNIFNLNGCAFVNCEHVGLINEVLTHFLTVNLDFCFTPISGVKYGVTSANPLTDSLPPDFTSTETNAIDPDLSPQYTDIDAGIAGDVEGLRLQARGKTTAAGGKYFLSSPLIDAFTTPDPDEDVNAWDESTVLTSEDFTDLKTIVWDPAGYKIIRTFVNPVSVTDINGNIHAAFDSVRRIIEFSFGEGDIYSNNNDRRKLIKLVSDTGTQRLYPRGIQGTLFYVSDPAQPDAVEGVFDATALTFAPSTFTGFPLIDDNWAGFWIIIDDGGTDKHFLIDSNNASQFTLINKLSETLPSSGTLPFKIQYITVKPEISDIEAVQQRFTEFRDGGSFREAGSDKVVSDTLAHELAGYSIRFVETRDLEEPL